MSTVDNSKTAYYSGWDIDQLVTTNSIAVSPGDTSVFSVVGMLFPVYELQFKPTGSTKWYSEGMSSTNNTLANLFIFSSYITGSAVHAVTSTSGTIRYYVWEDTVIH